MNDLLTKIANSLEQQKSVVLVGQTNSGKTYWIKNTLMPHLESIGKSVEYLKDGHEFLKGSPNIAVCDEVETLFDKKYLENGDENYYTEKYLDTVSNKWFKNYSSLPASTIFVITRNEMDQINNLLQNFKKADWDSRDIEVLKFEK
jgi:thymidylate synthase